MEMHAQQLADKWGQLSLNGVGAILVLDVDFLDGVETSQHTGACNSAENVGASTLEERPI